jgi:hypothetical protein
VLVDLVCPICLHDAGRVTFDQAARGACPKCGVILQIATNLQPVNGFPDKQLALRPERPRRSSMTFRRRGDRLVTSQRSWLLFLFMKKIELGPDGFATRTWRKRGSARLLSELRGFVMLQRCVERTTTPVHLVWVSHVVFRTGEGQFFGPLFAHGSYADGAYYCSVLNAHLAELCRSNEPYR